MTSVLYSNYIAQYMTYYIGLYMKVKFLKNTYIDQYLISYIGQYTLKFNNAQYMFQYSDHICFHVSDFIRPLHISAFRGQIILKKHNQYQKWCRNIC